LIEDKSFLFKDNRQSFAIWTGVTTSSILMLVNAIGV